MSFRLQAWYACDSLALGGANAVSEPYDTRDAGKYFVQVQQVDGCPAQSNTLELTVVP